MDEPKARRRWVRVLRGSVLGLLGAVALVWAALLAAAEGRHQWGSPGAMPASFSAGTGVDASAPVLILLHGAGLNGTSWDPVRRQLEPRFRVLTPDLPGHGVRRDGVYTLDAAVATVRAAALSVAPAPVILVGDSLGGYSAIAAAAALPPARLRGVVISGASGQFRWPDLLRYARDAGFIPLWMLFTDPQVLVGKALRMFGMGEEDARRTVAAGVSPKAVPLAVRSLLFADFRSRLARVEAPVLIANGTLDRRAMDQEAECLAAARHGEVHHFDGVEHGVSLRRPAEFAALVAAFAARTAVARP